MRDYSVLSQKEIFSDEVINEVMEETDGVTREQMKFDLIDRAADFGKKFEARMVSLLKVAEKELKKAQSSTVKPHSDSGPQNITQFVGLPPQYQNLKCGKWQADMSGIRDITAPYGDQVICAHPIIPVETIINVDGGPQKTKLLFNRGYKWEEFTVNKSVISGRNKITELADVGIAVNSENAKGLIKYLSTVETLNYDEMPKVRATAKMGWCEDGFMPYTSDLEFDRTSGFDTLFDTIQPRGSFSKWMDFVKEARKSGRIEPRLALAASFSSVLLKVCGLLPFWVDFWGTSGGGKSICGMLAASVWADPEFGKYISKFDFTAVGMEAKSAFLNNLPFVIDDTAEMKKRLKDDFTSVIYQLASGSGKERSNVKLALAEKKTWLNCIICSGESPIVSDQSQAGAINRVLEFEVDEGHIFEDGQAAATLLRANYGFAGPLFVSTVDSLSKETVAEMQREQFNAIKSDDYEDKQLLSLSVLLTADKIATEHIFKDGLYLSFEDLERTLTDKNTMSENERCYEYILGEVSVNSVKFMECRGDNFSETWGKYFSDKKHGGEFVAILANVMQRMCQSGNFNLKAFTAWAIKKGILQVDKANKKASKLVKMPDGHPQRCYVLKLPDTPIGVFLEEFEDDIII